MISAIAAKPIFWRSCDHRSCARWWAGRGFAVVAGEVKSLAHQQQRLTEDITGRSTKSDRDGQAVTAIRSISRGHWRHRRKDERRIAGCCGEQGAATTEISRNFQQAAQVRSESDLKPSEIAAIQPRDRQCGTMLFESVNEGCPPMPTGCVPR